MKTTPPKSARRLFRKTSFAGFLFALLFSIAVPLPADDYYWDADASAAGNASDGTGLGGAGTWDASTSNWWPVPPGALTAWPNGADTAIFTNPYAAGAPAAKNVTLSSGITASELSFLRSGYTLSGGTLTLAGATPLLHANLGESATVSSQITGTNGLTLTGGGTIRLTNHTNSYTGTTSLSNGSLIISHPAQLGPDTSAVIITATNPTPSNTVLTGFGGGSLVLDGTGGGITFARDLNIEGRGPIGERGAAVLSLGDNTLSGTVTSAVSPLTPATFRGSRINSVNGTLTLSGTVNSQGASASTFLALGGVNSAGVGNFDLNGVLSGTGSIEKSGGGTLFLNPSSTSGFNGTLRLSGSATGQQSSVRVEQSTVGGTSIFGANTGTNASGAIDMNGGVLEFRSEGNLDFASFSSGKNVYLRASSTYYTGPGVGGDGVNGTTTLGALRVAANANATFNSRNGYGMTLGTWTQESSSSQNTITNNMGGTLTFTGNAWNNNDASNRILTIGGNGNTVIGGSVNTSGSGVKTLTKTGSGALTITGANTTLNGPVNVQGSLVITDFRSINNNTQSITLGNATTTSGNLIIGTSTTPDAAGLVTSKPIIFNNTSTTATSSIVANQTGANPVVINGAITKPNATSFNIFLGGTNTADNVINSAIPLVGTGGVTKVGSGTWVLAGANIYTGTTTITNGTLKIKANAADSTVLPSTNAVTFNASNSFAGSTFEFVGQDDFDNVQNLGTLAYSAGSNTVKVTPGSGGTASLVFANMNTTGASTVNFSGADFNSNKVTLTQVNNAVGSNGVITRSVYFDGADFAYREGGVLRAPNYGTDGGTATTASGPMTSGSNQEITGSLATNNISIATLRIPGSHTLTINSGQTLTMTGAGILVTGGAATITGGTALATGSAVLVPRVNLGSDSLTIESVITGSGGLTKSGAGTLILAGANTRTGTTSIDEGTVRLSGAGTLSGNNVTTNIRQGATLDLNGVSTGGSIGQFNNNGTVTNSSASDVVLQIGNNITTNGTAGTSYGSIEDGTAGGQTSVVISTANNNAAQSTNFFQYGNSSYTGSTTLTKATAGNLTVTVNALADIGQASGIGAGDVNDNAGSLVFSGSGGTLVYQGSIVNGNLTLGSTSASTDRLFTLSGTGATLSSTATNNNAIVWSNTGAIEFGGAQSAKTLTFTGTSTGDNTFNPQITDSGTVANITSVTKTGTGQWNLGNTNNTYTGATTVANGILGLNDNGALPANSPLVLGSTTTSGILQMSGTFARDLTITPPAAGAGTITWGGTTGGGGFAAHSGPLTVTLNGGGGLTWGSGGFVGTGGTQALIFNSASALSDVTFTNAIDLGSAQRTVTVNDNGNTGADYATMTGVLSGSGGGITKNGNGVLKLTGNNTYTGTTEVQRGTLVVTSLGSSGSAGATSVGEQQYANTAGSAIVLGNSTTTGGILQYVGAGETSDRYIRLNGTAASNQIHADGSGPLILTKVAHDTTATGNKTLFLRGSNTAGNMITSALTDNVNGKLSVTVDGGATWILSGANTYTGTTSANAGALGIGSGSALGASTAPLSFNSGNIFAYGADRTIANPIDQDNQTTMGFLGDYSLNFTEALVYTGTSQSLGTNNNVAAGKTLTFGGLTADAITGNRTWTIDGSGETVINGDITTTSNFNLNITKTGRGTLQLNGTASDWNAGTLDIDNGTLRLGASEVIPNATDSGALVFSPELSVGDTATLDLNGKSETITALTATTDGAVIIDNTSGSGAAFRFGANNSTVNFGTGTGTYTIQNTGAGALDIVKLGNTAATFNSGVTVGNAGTIASEGGGTFTIAGPVTAASGFRAIDASTLALTGGITNPGLVTGIEVGGGSTLTLLDGAGSVFSNLTSLALGNTGAAGATATLNLNVGDGATDTLNLLADYSAVFGANTVTFNLTDAGLSANKTYTLLNLADGGITAFGTNKMIQGAMPGGFDAMNWNVTDNLVQLSTGGLITGDLFWRGSAGGGTDNTWNANADNWSQDKANTTVATSLPGQGTDVIFAIDSASGDVATTLEQNFKVNSLNFKAGATTTPSSVTINSGSPSTNRIEIAPQLASDGIAISAGGPASVAINTAVKIGADQTWNVADPGSALTLGGALLGEAGVTKSGNGKVILTGTADATFNNGQTAAFTVGGGAIEIQNVAALGTAANNNLANVIVNPDGAFYYSGAANTAATGVANNLTLAGGTLSAGGNAGHNYYTGTVSVSANSTINMRGSNSAIETATQGNVVLSGPVSGTGKLTVDSISAKTGGNQYTGTLYLQNDNSAWSGGINLLRGNIQTQTTTGLGTGDITASAGRIQFVTPGGTNHTLNQNITVDADGGILELSADASGTPVSDMTVNLNGTITIGSAANADNALRFYQASDNFSVFNIGGPIVLGNDASITYQGSSVRSLVIPTVISDGGSGYSLAINDERGGWGGTSRTVQLTGLNTFSGNISVKEGTLEFDTVTDKSGGASALGNGTAISMAGGTLSFIGSTSQSTNRTISTTASSTLSANGTGGATITYTGGVTQNTNNALTLTGTGEGVITGGITQLGTSADLYVNSGTWNLTGTNTIGDDVIVTGVGTILNLNSASVIKGNSVTSAGLYARSGATINLNAHAAYSSGDGLDFIFLNDNATGTSTLATNGFDITTPRLDLGQTTSGYVGNVTGSGTVTVTSAINLYEGNIAANLAGAGKATKSGSATVILSGANSYTGATAISADGGILQLGDGGTGGSLSTDSAISVGAGATFAVNQSDTVTQGTDFSGAAITGAGGFTQAGAGTTILTAANTYGGATTVSGGTLLATSAGALPGYATAGRVSVAGGATLAVRAGGAGEWTPAEIDSLLGATTAAFAAGSNLGVDVGAGNSITYANDIGATQAAKGLTKSGDGTLILTGANTYTGATTVNGGTLLIEGAMSGPLTVGADATLGGSGKFTGPVVILDQGGLAPGDSPGIQTYAAGLTLNTGSTFSWELVGNTISARGTSFDGVDITGGNLEVQNGVHFNLILDGSLNGGTSAVNFTDSFWDGPQQWLLFDVQDTATASVIDPSTFLLTVSEDKFGNAFPVDAGFEDGFANFYLSQDASGDIFLNYSAVVPEPATTGLLALMLGGWLTFFRRRRNL